MAGQKYNKAYEAYQQAVYRDGRNPTFWCSIGVLYFQINQYRDALDAYSRAIRINPYISEVWFDLQEGDSNHLRANSRRPRERAARRDVDLDVDLNDTAIDGLNPHAVPRYPEHAARRDVNLNADANIRSPALLCPRAEASPDVVGIWVLVVLVNVAVYNHELVM